MNPKERFLNSIKLLMVTYHAINIRLVADEHAEKFLLILVMYQHLKALNTCLIECVLDYLPRKVQREFHGLGDDELFFESPLNLLKKEVLGVKRLIFLDAVCLGTNGYSPGNR